MEIIFAIALLAGVGYVGYQFGMQDSSTPPSTPPPYRHRRKRRRR